MLALAFTLSGCISDNMPGNDVTPPQNFQPAERPVTVENEQNARYMQIGRQQHPKILAPYGGEYSDPKLERMR